MAMKKKTLLTLALGALLTMASCTGSKDVPYFQNIEEISLAGSKGLYEAKIMPKDELTITVSTTDPTAAAPFNLAVSATMGVGGQLNSTGNVSASSMLKYLVDNNGMINFPVIGRIHVAGLTKPQCEDLITEKIRPYLAKTEHPIVTVRMSSYRIVVLGEVGKSAVIPVTTEKMSVVEAVAQAGDLGIYGLRDNILLIREDATGEKSYHRLNLTDANIFNSPYYYLQQNDIIYVQPNSVKAKNSQLGASTSLWFSFIGIVTSLASLLVNVLR